jgi:hypothetical protein
MTDNQRILADALPFDLDEHSEQGQLILNSVPSRLWDAVGRAELHQDLIEAQDKIADYISQNYRMVLRSDFLTA